MKRWFTCIDMDLFVWLHKNMNDDVNGRMKNCTPVRFQLSFNKRSKEQLISRELQQGLQFYEVDSGESFVHQYKETPLMIDTCEQLHLATIAQDFLLASENIDPGLTDFIYARLTAYPVSNAMLDAAHKDRPVVN
jgi:hypothetical protein